MVKSLSDTALDLICSKITHFECLQSSVTSQHKTEILKRLSIHQRLTREIYTIVKNQLLSPILQHVALQQSPQVDDEFLKLLGECCAGLKTLDVISCSGVTDKGLELAFKNLTKIQSLQLIGLGKIAGTCFQFLLSKSLHIVNLKYCENLIDDGIAALVQNCQAICSLNLFGCSKITDIGIEFIAGYLLGKLDTLICSNVSKITDTSLIAIADRCYNLKCLKLHGCTKVTSTGLRAVFKACPISTTDLSYCYALSKETDIVSDCLPATLSRLILRGTQVPTSFYETLVSRCKNIHTLKLCGIQSLTDEAASQILETIGARLENLDLSWCGTVTDTTLKSVIDHCSNLTKLGLSFCKGITGEPMKELTFLSRKKQAKKAYKASFAGL